MYLSKDAVEVTGSVHEKPTTSECSNLLTREKKLKISLKLSKFCYLSKVLLSNKCTEIKNLNFKGHIRRFLFLNFKFHTLRLCHFQSILYFVADKSTSTDRNEKRIYENIEHSCLIKLFQLSQFSCSDERLLFSVIIYYERKIILLVCSFFSSPRLANSGCVNCKIFEKNIFTQNGPTDTMNAVLRIQPNLFPFKVRKINLKNQKLFALNVLLDS